MPQLVKTWQTFLSGVDKIRGRQALRARPLRIHLEINDFCNLKCIMCSRENPAIPKDSGAISLDTVRRLAPYLRTASRVGIAGNGEPFMHVELLDILDEICSHGAVPSVVSNCTLLRQDVCDRLVQLGPSLLMASIDGGSKAVFESIRLGANFDRIRENLLRLRATKQRAATPYPVVNFISCLMKQNLEDLENLVRFAAEVGAAEINVQNLFPYHDDAWPHIVTDFDLLDRRIGDARALAAELGVVVRYSPMGFSVEERMAHAERTGDATSPAAGLQLNGRLNEAKTVGRRLGDLLEAKRAGREPQRLLEAPRDATKDVANDIREQQAVAAVAAVAGAGDLLLDAQVKMQRAPGAGVGGGASGGCASAPPAEPTSADATGEAYSAATHKLVEAAPPAANDRPGEPKYYCANVFQQLHVTVTGEVRPCCFWTGKTLGNVKERPVDEIWNDPYFQSVRAAILSGKLPKDCRTCHNLVPYDRAAIWSDTHRELLATLKV